MTRDLYEDLTDWAARGPTYVAVAVILDRDDRYAGKDISWLVLWRDDDIVWC